MFNGSSTVWKHISWNLENKFNKPYALKTKNRIFWRKHKNRFQQRTNSIFANIRVWLVMMIEGITLPSLRDRESLTTLSDSVMHFSPYYFSVLFCSYPIVVIYAPFLNIIVSQYFLTILYMQLSPKHFPTLNMSM